MLPGATLVTQPRAEMFVRLSEADEPMIIKYRKLHEAAPPPMEDALGLFSVDVRLDGTADLPLVRYVIDTQLEEFLDGVLRLESGLLRLTVTTAASAKSLHRLLPIVVCNAAGDRVAELRSVVEFTGRVHTFTMAPSFYLEPPVLDPAVPPMHLNATPTTFAPTDATVEIPLDRRMRDISDFDVQRIPLLASATCLEPVQCAIERRTDGTRVMVVLEKHYRAVMALSHRVSLMPHHGAPYKL